MINKDSRLESYWHRCSFKSCAPSLILSRIFGLGDEHLAARVGLRAEGGSGQNGCAPLKLMSKSSRAWSAGMLILKADRFCSMYGCTCIWLGLASRVHLKPPMHGD